MDDEGEKVLSSTDTTPPCDLVKGDDGVLALGRASVVDQERPRCDQVDGPEGVLAGEVEEEGQESPPCGVLPAKVQVLRASQRPQGVREQTVLERVRQPARVGER